MLDRETFLNMSVVTGTGISFEMSVGFDNLIDGLGIDTLNAQVEEFVDDGLLLEDLSFIPLRVVNDDIVVKVIADATEFLKHNPVKRLKSISNGQVQLEVVECSCGFHLGIDATYLDQVGDFVIPCPSCNEDIETSSVCPEGEQLC